MVNTAKLYMLKLVPKLKFGNGKDGKKKSYFHCVSLNDDYPCNLK